MNIFFLEHHLPDEPLKSYAKRIAASHCDLHQKQILENWQMLNTNCNVLGIKTDNSSIAYKNHPCTVWARSSLANWQFLYHLTEQLSIEFMHRNNKSIHHKSWVRVKENVPYGACGLLSGDLTTYPMAMPAVISESAQNSPVEAYRAYYNTHKAFFSRRKKIKGSFGQEIIAYQVAPAAWKNRDVPEWWNPVSFDNALENGYIKATDAKGKQFSLSQKDIILWK